MNSIKARTSVQTEQPSPLTGAERQRAYRATLKAQGLTEVSGIYAPVDQHKTIREIARMVIAGELKLPV